MYDLTLQQGVHERYNAKSILSFDVKSGGNTANFKSNTSEVAGHTNEVAGHTNKGENERDSIASVPLSPVGGSARS